MSKAVSEGAIRALANLRRKAEAGQLRSEDVRATIVTSQIYFSHLEETGFNALMDAKLKDPEFRRQVLEFSPFEEEIEVLRSRTAMPDGTLLPINELQDLFKVSYGKRAVAFDSLAQMGMAAFQAKILDRLAKLEAKLSLSRGMARTQWKQPHLLKVVSECCTAAEETGPDLCETFELAAIAFAACCLILPGPCCGAALLMELYAWLCRNGFLII